MLQHLQLLWACKCCSVYKSIGAAAWGCWNLSCYPILSNSVVLDRAGIFSMYTLLKQLCLHWLGHVVRMADGRIPKDLLYGECRETTAVIQGYLQAGPEGLRNGPQQMGNPDLWAFSLEAGGASWPLPFWIRDPCPAGWGQEAVMKAAKSGSWTGDRLYLSSVRKGWSFSNLSLIHIWRCRRRLRCRSRWSPYH